MWRSLKNLRSSLLSSPSVLMQKWNHFDQQFSFTIHRNMTTFRVKTLLQNKSSENAPQAQPETPQPQEDVPFMITRRMKLQLSELGYNAQEVSDMTPQDAYVILKSHTAHPSASTSSSNTSNSTTRPKPTVASSTTTEEPHEEIAFPTFVLQPPTIDVHSGRSVMTQPAPPAETESTPLQLFDIVHNANKQQQQQQSKSTPTKNNSNNNNKSPPTSSNSNSSSGNNKQL